MNNYAEQIIRQTLGFEGGYVKSKIDKGGETKYGVSDMRDGVNDGMTDVDGNKKPDTLINDLTIDEAIMIYKRDYWDKMNLDLIASPVVAAKLFDIGVNMGTERAIMMVQEIVVVNVDGDLGPVTARMVNAENDAAIVSLLRKAQMLRYADICVRDNTQIGNLKGWINRAYKC